MTEFAWSTLTRIEELVGHLLDRRLARSNFETLFKSVKFCQTAPALKPSTINSKKSSVP